MTNKQPHTKSRNPEILQILMQTIWACPYGSGYAGVRFAPVLRTSLSAALTIPHAKKLNYEGVEGSETGGAYWA